MLSVSVLVAVLSLLATASSAQRVQFPTPTQPVPTTNPYSVPSTAPIGSPLPATGPYPTTPYTVSPYATTPLPASPYSPAAVGPPPLFDPYASGSGIATPPPVVPYSPPPATGTVSPPPLATPYGATPGPIGGPYGPPPPASAFPQPGPTISEVFPYQWQPAPYDMATSAESYWDKTWRLCQEASAEYTFLYRGNDATDFGLDRLELTTTFAFPLFYNIQTPLLVTPGFAFNWLDGPSQPGADLPPRVYDAYLDFAWYPRWNEWFGAELGLRTGVWSDFDHVTTDSIRILGRGLASVAITPNLDVLFGAVYLDRLEVKLLPAGGFYYRPTPDWDMYLVFPNPKVRRFLSAIGNTKWYGYAAGEYGGGTWTVDRNVTNDQFDYNDIRIIGGIEWETQTFIRGHLEIGYVWDRELVYRSKMPPKVRPDDTVMLRAGIGF